MNRLPREMETSNVPTKPKLEPENNLPWYLF